MLSKLDDYPVHQTPEPLYRTASSDRNTYDRYWYNAHAKDSSFYFGVALCRYPNLGILDCSLSIVADGEQHAFHGSCRAPDEPTDTRVGPFKLKILEPMGRHQITIAPNDTGIECDLIFTPKTGAIQEARQTLGNHRYVVMDATRLDQFGSWSGTIRYNGKEIIVDGETTFGLKDRSWGIRPVGDAYTGGAPMDAYQANHFMWLPIHWPNECTLAGWFEDGDGYQWHTDQGIVPSYSTMDAIPAVVDPAMKMWNGKVVYDIDLQPGTRHANSGSFTMTDRSGASMDITVEMTGMLHRMKGLGYQNPEWGHGKWHDELKIGSENWQCNAVDPLALENIHLQQVIIARRTLPSGETEIGHGVLEQMHMGRHAVLGFDDWFDGAK
jgi:hypothetical protein